MTVYADILFIVNFLVDYFLITVASRFLRKRPKLWRMLLSAALGGVFSFYILLPQSEFIFQLTIQLFMCAVLCLAAFGFGNLKAFFRAVTVLFLINFAYSGAMIAVWLMFKPYGMVINNSVVYFNISPIFLIAFSSIGYLLVAALRRLLKRPFLQNTYCSVTLRCDQNELTANGIVDSGNSLCDVFGLSQIFITDSQTAAKLLTKEQSPTRFRKIPAATVTGEALLNGYRIDSATVLFNQKSYSFKNPILAVSDTPLNDCKIIVNPQSLM